MKFLHISWCLLRLHWQRICFQIQLEDYLRMTGLQFEIPMLWCYQSLAPSIKKHSPWYRYSSQELGWLGFAWRWFHLCELRYIANFQAGLPLAILEEQLAIFGHRSGLLRHLYQHLLLALMFCYSWSSASLWQFAVAWRRAALETAKVLLFEEARPATHGA